MCRDWQEDAWSQNEQPSQSAPALTQPLQDELTDDWADFLDEPADTASTAPKQIPREGIEDSNLFSEAIDEDIGDGISEDISEDIRSSQELELKAPPAPRQRSGVEAWAPRGRKTGPRQRDAARTAQRAEPPRQQGAWTTSGDELTGTFVPSGQESLQN